MDRITLNFRFLLLLFSMIGSLALKAQSSDEPIITIYSSAYDEVGEDNKFSLFLGALESGEYVVQQPSGTETVTVEPSAFNSESGDFDGTWIPCSVDASGIIKIYGDPANLNIIKAEGAYITAIDMDQCVNLQVINLQHNALQRLDLTPFTSAYAIYLSDNPFTAETPLTVGTPKPDLAILEIDIIDHLDQSFNLSDYPSMVAFDGYANSDLRFVDPTGCPNLMVLSVEMTPVETLDVSQNPQLIRLNISESRIRNIDISNNPNLQHLLANHDSGTINTDIKLEGIDLTHNPQLTLLNLSSNDFSSVDVSQNTLLTHLSLNNNLLTSLDLSNNTELYSVAIINNLMDFATLPSPQPTWGEYYYPQRPMQVPRSIAVDQPLDLSSRVLREGTDTWALVYSQPYDTEPVLLDESLYSYIDGILTFNTALNDSVYAVFYNSELDEYALKTSPFLVKEGAEMGKPSRIAAFSLSVEAGAKVAFSVGLSEASAEAPKSFFVRTADTEIECFSTFSDLAPGIPANVELTFPAAYSGVVEIYIKEEDVMTCLDVSGLQLYSLDVTAATELRQLAANGCGLYYIDLRFNRCLYSLSLANNNLYSIDLKGIYGNYEKYVLTDIDLSHNSLSEFELVSPLQIERLNLSYNQLQKISLKDYDRLEKLDLSYNQLSEDLSLAYLGATKSINVSGNYITSLTLPEFTALEKLDVTANALTIATLPLPSCFSDPASYIYAPQSQIKIEPKSNFIDLSDQNRVVDGESTRFTWLRSDGEPLIEGVDYTCIDGATTFLNPAVGAAYCLLTHPAFPQFEGADVLSTTDVVVSDAPSFLVASFTTLEDSQKGEVILATTDNSTLYIDWKGDGSDLREYKTQTYYTDYQNQRTYAGANVKIYSFLPGDNITIFSLYDMKLTDVDLSQLTGLTALSIGGAGISADQIVMPDAPELSELKLIGNKFTDFPYADNYPRLGSLVMTNNSLTSFDASPFPLMGTLTLDNNSISDITLSNPNLWSLSLNNNALSSIDLSSVPNMYQLMLHNNQLSSIDIEPVKESLYVLIITGNKFTFATLPLFSEYPKISVAYYSDQAQVPAECVDGEVDLSSMLLGNGADTSFSWYLGKAAYDASGDSIAGVPLILGEDYSVENGVTYFHRSFDQQVMCIMQNEQFPNLLLSTPLIWTSVSGIADIAGESDPIVDVYSTLGVAVRRGVVRSQALQGLAPGLYIVGSRKVVVK